MDVHVVLSLYHRLNFLMEGHEQMAGQFFNHQKDLKEIKMED